MKLIFFPKKQQWNNWTLPSKLTLLGTYIGVISLAITIYAAIDSKFPNKDKTDPKLVAVVDGHSISEIETRQLNYLDYKKVASLTAESIVADFNYKSIEDRKLIIAEARIVNDTYQRIGQDQIMPMIRERLIKNNKIIFTDIISAKHNKADTELRNKILTIRDNQSKNLKKHLILAPTHIFSGNIRQSNIKLNNGVQIEYNFSFRLTSIKTGEPSWVKNIIIAKIIK